MPSEQRSSDLIETEPDLPTVHEAEEVVEPGHPETLPTMDQLVVWHGSTAARTLNCRGWNRGAVEWVKPSVDSFAKDKAREFAKNSENPRYRTRLCSHWDSSSGTFCPMKKKGKCIFAHGPVELRVKAEKRKRWGRLVDPDGNCKNLKASGGEDTYGAARAIENERSRANESERGEDGRRNGNKKQTPSKYRANANRRPPLTGEEYRHSRQKNTLPQPPAPGSK